MSYFSDTTDFKSTNEYRLLGAVGTLEGCGDERGDEQRRIFGQALYATKRYEIAGDRLILSGDQARLTFVIDNEATNRLIDR